MSDKTNQSPLELEETSRQFQPIIDRRPLVPEPLPVRIVAVEDVRLPAASGAEKELEAFYIGLLGFAREDSLPESHVLRAENVRLTFDIFEPPMVRESMRTLGIEVLSLSAIQQKFVDAEIEFTYQRGLMPGQDGLFLQDPAGNWLLISEIQLLR